MKLWKIIEKRWTEHFDVIPAGSDTDKEYVLELAQNDILDLIDEIKAREETILLLAQKVTKKEIVRDAILKPLTIRLTFSWPKPRLCENVTKRKCHRRA